MEAYSEARLRTCGRLAPVIVMVTMPVPVYVIVTATGTDIVSVIVAVKALGRELWWPTMWVYNRAGLCMGGYQESVIVTIIATDTLSATMTGIGIDNAICTLAARTWGRKALMASDAGVKQRRCT